jgi:prepilin-type N-terminal cleavage/methylation domain-containing protein
MHRRGFNLIELLVVIAIIAIHCGDPLPRLRQGARQGRQSACQSNIKQLSLGLAHCTPRTTMERMCYRYYRFDPAVAGGPHWDTGLVQPYVKNTQFNICPGHSEPLLRLNEDYLQGQPLALYPVPARDLHDLRHQAQPRRLVGDVY